MSTRTSDEKSARAGGGDLARVASAADAARLSRARLIRLVATRPEVRTALGAYFAEHSMPRYSTRIATERLAAALGAIGVVRDETRPTAKSRRATADVTNRFGDAFATEERKTEERKTGDRAPTGVAKREKMLSSVGEANANAVRTNETVAAVAAATAAAATSAEEEEEKGEQRERDKTDDAREKKREVPDAKANGERRRVVVITGAARGIGRAAAVAFARTNAHVVGIDICAPVCGACDVKPASRGDLRETGRLVEAAGGRWSGFVADQRRIGALRSVAATILATIGGADVLFANAGIQGFASLLAIGDDSGRDRDDDDDDDDSLWQTTLDVNLTGTANAIRAFAPHMVARKKGRIVVTTSTQGRHGTLDGAAYSASKWGIIGLMKSAALELGPHGITVNAVAPGLVDTPLTRHEQRYAQIIRDAALVPSGSARVDEGVARKLMVARTPLRVPWLRPEDVAGVVVFLASDSARMVSGATYDVTGGDSAHNV